MAKLHNFLRKYLFPTDFTCDICGEETFGGNICPTCAKKLEFNDGETCPVCGRKTVRPEICLECKANAPQYLRAVSALVYDGNAKTLIAKFKNGGAYLKEYFADLIAEKVKVFGEIDGIIAVPMTAKSERKRGYNQAELLAESLSERLGVPVMRGAVVKKRQTSAQKSLTMKERQENLKGCFKAEKRDMLRGKDVLVVDDVLTTGATADELCRTLHSAGVVRIYFATIASVEYKHGG